MVAVAQGFQVVYVFVLVRPCHELGVGRFVSTEKEPCFRVYVNFPGGYIYDISDRWFAKHWGALVLVPVRSSKECVLYSRDNQGSYRSTIEISSCV